MPSPFPYQGALGNNTRAVLDHIEKIDFSMFVDLLAGSCRLSYEVVKTRTRVDLVINDLNTYCCVNAQGIFTPCTVLASGARALLENVDSQLGVFESLETGFWSKEYRRFIDGVVKTTSDSTILAGVSRALLEASWRGVTWADKLVDGRLTIDLTRTDAINQITHGVQTTTKKNVADLVQSTRVFSVPFQDLLQQIELHNHALVFIDPPWPWKDHSVGSPFSFYDPINAILNQKPLVPISPFDWRESDVDEKINQTFDTIDYCLEKGAWILMEKQSLALPDSELLWKSLPKETIVDSWRLPIRGGRGKTMIDSTGQLTAWEDWWLLKG